MCNECVEVCPKNAISITSNIEISGACDLCGLCVAACPNGVFVDQRTQDLWKDLQEYGARVSVACHAVADCEERDGVVVPCVGVVTLECLLLASVVGGVRRVDVTHGDCDRCERRKGRSMFIRAVQQATSLLGDVELLTVNLRMAQGECRPLSRFAGLYRREILSLLTRPLFSLRKTASDVNERRLALISALGRLQSKVSLFSLEALFSEVDVSDRCTGCPICEAVCPTGALVRTVTPECITLRFDFRFCTNCKNCVVACPECAITTKNRSLTNEVMRNLIRDETEKPVPMWHTIALVKTHSCPSCGGITPARYDVCLACQGKRPTDSVVIIER